MDSKPPPTGYTLGYCATITARYLYVGGTYQELVRVVHPSPEEAQAAARVLTPRVLARCTGHLELDPASVEITTQDFWVPCLLFSPGATHV